MNLDLGTNCLISSFVDYFNWNILQLPVLVQTNERFVASEMFQELKEYIFGPKPQVTMNLKKNMSKNCT